MELNKNHWVSETTKKSKNENLIKLNNILILSSLSNKAKDFIIRDFINSSEENQVKALENLSTKVENRE